MGGDSERHQLPVSLSRAVLALVVVACVVAIAAGVLSGRRAPVVEVSDGSPVVETSDGSPSVSVTMTGSSGDAKSSEDKGTSAGEGEPGGEAFESSDLSGVPEEAAVLVREYEGRDDCVLVRSGYLDLSGRVWSMVVEGSGWVDVCLVQSTDDGTIETKVMHMDVAEWAASLAALGFGG